MKINLSNNERLGNFSLIWFMIWEFKLIILPFFFSNYTWGQPEMDLKPGFAIHT
jgi:hypothetical protein